MTNQFEHLSSSIRHSYMAAYTLPERTVSVLYNNLENLDTEQASKVSGERVENVEAFQNALKVRFLMMMVESADSNFEYERDLEQYKVEAVRQNALYGDILKLAKAQHCGLKGYNF